MKKVLVIVTADPRASDRALEGLRMSAGVALANNSVEVALAGEATRYLGAECAALPEGGRAANLLGALAELGIRVEARDVSAADLPRYDVVVRWTDD
jgi:hypothetical protein